MGKVFGSSCLVAGTAIGAGMLALPMVFAKVGLIQSILLMLVIWGLAYYSALLGSELNLRATTPLALGALSRQFSGRKAELIGQTSFMMLCYALLSAYLDGSSSIISSLIRTIPDTPKIASQTLLHIVTGSMAVLLLLSMTLIDYINRFLFAAMVIILIIVMGVLLTLISPGSVSTTTLIASGSSLSLVKAVPIVFTSFGFQIIFHTICNYLDMNASKIKQAFFWGSLVPALAYVSWTVISLVFIASHHPGFFTGLNTQSIDVGDFIYVLSQASNFPLLKNLSWILSILAVITSAIGVGLGLAQTWKTLINNHPLSVALTIVPPYIIANKVPEAFIHALGFAGMILVIIALLLPMYLLYQSDDKTKNYYKILQNKGLRLVIISLSLMIMFIEIFHLLKWL